MLMANFKSIFWATSRSTAPDGRDVTPSGKKQRALIACLALAPDSGWPRERLTAVLWSNRDEEHARGSLRQALADLRRTIGEPSPLRSDRETVALDLTVTRVDAVEFTRLASMGELEPAAELYRGDLLDGLSLPDSELSDWLLVERTRLRDLAVAVLSRLAQSQQGDAALRTAHRLLHLDAAHEASHRAVMRLHAARGDRAQAIRQYQICRDILQRELAVVPSVETENLLQEIRSARSQVTTTKASAELPDKPSIAVLPFTNMGSNPEQDYFADGIAEEIITALCRVKSLFVVPRNSSLIYKGRAVEATQVGRELGVRYVLEGSVRKAGGRVRISGQLIDATSGRHVWADRLEGELEDIFELQDRITESVVGAVEPAIRLIEVERTRVRSTESLDAYELYLRALLLHHTNSRESFSEAQRLLARAIEIDPTYAMAKAFAALTTATRTAQGWTNKAEREQGIRWAREAVTDDHDDPVIMRSAGHALVLLAQEYDLAVALLDRALSLNPNSAEVHHSAGWVWVFAGDGSKAIEHFCRAMRLNPFDPERGRTLAGLAFAQLLLDRCGEALQTSTKALAAMPTSLVAMRAAIIALVQLGNREEAVAMGKKLLAINPSFRIDDWSKLLSFRDSAFVERYLTSLRAAGLPE